MMPMPVICWVSSAGRHLNLSVDTSGRVASLALLVDAFRCRTSAFKIGSRFYVAGRVAHARQKRLPLDRDISHCFVPPQPAGRQFGRIEVVIGEGQVDLIKPVRMGVHVLHDPVEVISRLFDRYRFCGWRSLFFVLATRYAENEPDDQKDVNLHDNSIAGRPPDLRIKIISR
jgi:hypothetical protein